MKKKMLSLALAAALLAGATVPAMAAGSAGTANNAVLPATENSFVASPAGGQDARSDDEEIEIVTDNVVTGGYIRQRGTAESRPLEQIDYPVIKITTLAMSAPSNDKIDAANPGATGDQKAGMMTESGLTYGKNDTVNETADRYYAAETTGDFVDNYSLSFFDNLVTVVEGNLENYSAVQIADISANSLALGTGKDVRLTFSAPGVKTNSRVMVARIRNGSMEFIPSTAGSGTISFDVHPSSLGTFVLLVRGEQ